MSLHKAIEHGKEKRKPYRGSASFDSSCRHGGGCSWCVGNRQYRVRQVELSARDEMESIDLDDPFEESDER